jgi:MSHA biogenesis protein MshO
MNRSSQAGFTLMEMVVALTITVAIVCFAVTLTSTPVNSYFSQQTREELHFAANNIKRELEADLSTALPNSVRIRNAGTRSIVEMLRVEEVAFYRGTGTVGDGTRELDLGVIDTQFSSIGQLINPAIARPYSRTDLYLAVGNQGSGPTKDAYRVGNQVRTPAGTKIDFLIGGTQGEDKIQITPGFRFAATTAPPKLFLVSGPVTYICNSAANSQTVHRYDNYPITTTIPTTETSPQLTGAGVNTSVIAKNVGTCSFRCLNLSTAPCVGAVTIDISLQKSGTNGMESIRVFHTLPVENPP